jgi:hypothetical protein
MADTLYKFWCWNSEDQKFRKSDDPRTFGEENYARVFVDFRVISREYLHQADKFAPMIAFGLWTNPSDNQEIPVQICNWDLTEEHPWVVIMLLFDGAKIGLLDDDVHQVEWLYPPEPNLVM